jgi:D-alanyl-D-alanine carboxypeptidase/D-alanyl-D-alanine-endopeptidase (penicillin-binding protein 4)
VLLETPARDVLRLTNAVTTGDDGSRRNLDIERDAAPDHVELKVTGSVPAKSGTDRYYRTVGDPLAYFMGAMSEIFSQVGIKVQGEFIRGTVPEDARTLVELSSPPLSTILFDINKYSNNFMAETILRTLGAHKSSLGTNEAGLAVVRGYLTSIGVPAEAVVIKNGSGLSRDTRLAPEHLTAVLVDMARDPKVSPEFVASLSIAGRDGTLRRRMTDTEGAVRGKTGTLSGVHCLAGYVETRDHEQLAFVFLANEVRGSVARVKDLQDSFVEHLSELDLGALER